jgi:RHS repeat-associated protein
LASNVYYDRNNRIVAAAPAYATGTELAYDGAGRQYQRRAVIALQSTTYSSGAYQYCAPAPNPALTSMSGGNNGVLTLAHNTLDSNGNVLEVDSFEDNHDDVLGGTPGINLTTNSNYVRRTVFNWFDPANRVTTVADYGSGDPSTGAGQWKFSTIPSRPSTAPTTSANTNLVTRYGYASDTGRLQTTTNPAGTVTKYFYDNLGRYTFVAHNWQNFVPPNTGTGNPNDRVMQFLYYGPTQLQQLIAMDPAGTGSSPNQVTTYYYVDPVDATRNTNRVYPDSSDSGPTGTNQLKYAYNVDGSLAQCTDQRGVIRAFSYTNNRLLSTDSVTTLPSGVDGTIQSIVHTYDTLNRPLNITSYAASGGTGTVVNDLQYAYYNGTGKAQTSFQEHYGAVNAVTSLNIQYTYDTTTSGSVYSNQLRLLTEVHPNGRSIYYDYGASSSTTAAYNASSNVREIWDGSPSGTGLAVYDYNGAQSRLAIATYPQPKIKLDHFEGTSGAYAGFDRFGRVVDQYWAGFSGTPDVDRFYYAYDYVDNRQYRQVSPAIYPTDNMDQAYTYDPLRRLLTSQVGTLAGSMISGTPASQESWTLDGPGNWSGYITQVSGSTTLNQTRTATPANAISGISASVGSTWATPAYDLAGNMTTIPIPGNLTSSYTAVYDAWNRMVSLANGSTTVATYSYDGLNRRIAKGVYVAGALDHKEHTYFNEAWQALEVRKEVSGTINPNPLEQYVWHRMYSDAPVLRDYDATTSGSPTRYYYTWDANYNVTSATSSGGSPAERYYYAPYGNLLFLDGSFNVLGVQQSQIGNAVAYTGRQYDAESGCYFHRFRYYHPSLGTFLARDPLGGDSAGNLYQYTYSCPLNSVDPFGLDPNNNSVEYWLNLWPRYFRSNANDVGQGWWNAGSWAGKTAYNAYNSANEAVDAAAEYVASHSSAEVTEKAMITAIKVNVAIGNAAIDQANSAYQRGMPIVLRYAADPSGEALSDLDEWAMDRPGLSIGEALYWTAWGAILDEMIPIPEAAVGIEEELGPINLGAQYPREYPGMGTYRPSRALPRSPDGVMIPDSQYPHTQLGTEYSRKAGPYTTAREWGENGYWIQDFHFTDHGRPNIPGHTNPHIHRRIGKTQGGTPEYGPALQWHLR